MLDSKMILSNEHVGLVRVLNDLRNGYFENIAEFVSKLKFEFIKGDICDFQTCINTVEKLDYILEKS
jgi:UDP-N-acetylglucosamine 4-epimerase